MQTIPGTCCVQFQADVFHGVVVQYASVLATPERSSVAVQIRLNVVEYVGNGLKLQTGLMESTLVEVVFVGGPVLNALSVAFTLNV